MTSCEELKTLIQTQVMIDIEEAIDALYEEIAEQKQATPEQQEATMELQEMREEFKILLAEIESGDMEAEECEEILDEIIEMRSES